MAKKQRLDKAISMQGNLSRSEVKTLIRKGAVTVNGQVVKAADFGVDFDSDTVQVQGKPLCLRMHLYLMLNKTQRSGQLQARTKISPPSWTWCRKTCGARDFSLRAGWTKTPPALC